MICHRETHLPGKHTGSGMGLVTLIVASCLRKDMKERYFWRENTDKNDINIIHEQEFADRALCCALKNVSCCHASITKRKRHIYISQGSALIGLV